MGRRFSLRGWTGSVARLVAVFFLPLALMAGGAQAESFRALSTTGMIGDIVANVVGEEGQTDVLLGSGVDPHGYALTRSDTARLLAADIVFYNGLALEGRMGDAMERVAAQGGEAVAVAEQIDRGFLIRSEDFQGQFDPHIWMDVAGWIAATQVVRDSLTAFRPQSAEAFAANAQAYTAELEELADYAANILAQVPESARKLVTAHDAFVYLGRAHDYEVVGIQGISTESEAGLRRITEIVDLIVENEIPAVFIETTVSDRNVRALVEGAAARGHEVEIGGELFSDAMGEPGSYEGTYIGMIDHNVTTIARALGAPADASGMAGRLSASR